MSNDVTDWGIGLEVAAQLHQEIIDYRRLWRECSTRGRYSERVPAFIDKGVPLPADFLEKAQHQEKFRSDFLNRLRGATQKIPSEAWRFPGLDVSLHDLDTSMERLKCACREHDRRVREFRNELIQPLNVLARVTTGSSVVREHLKRVQDRMTELVTNLKKGTLSENGKAKDSAAAVRALLTLIPDAAQSHSPEGAADLNSPEAFGRMESAFELVSSQMGAPLALAAMKGLLRISAADPSESGSSAAAAVAGSASNVATRSASPRTLPAEPSDRPTSDQIASLIENLQGSPGASAVAADSVRRPRPESVKQHEHRFPVSYEDSDCQLSVHLDRLKQMRHALNAPPITAGEQQLSAEQLRAIGYWNLEQITRYLLALLKRRESGPNDCRHDIEQTVLLMAEAQAAVRSEAEMRDTAPPEEQTAIFYWLRNFVSRDAEKILVPRGMRETDVVLPEEFPGLQAKIRQHCRPQENERRLQNLSAAIRSLIRACESQESDTAATVEDSQLRKLAETVETCLKNGVLYSDKSMREQLEQAYDCLPELDEAREMGLSDSFLKVLENLYAVIDERQRREDEEANRKTQRQPSQTVREVAKLLKDRVVVLVCGIEKPNRGRVIQEQLGLKELRWMSATDTSRVAEGFPQLVGSSVVILITGHMGHKHTAFREVCKDRGILCVQTKKAQGYGVETLAKVIMDQAGDRLKDLYGETGKPSPPE
ncbi:MAG: hypothetical protein R3C49_23440 [Planctomycetaceae bacterium]